MTILLQSPSSAVADCLAQHTDGVKVTGRNRWEVLLAGRPSVWASVSLESQWLHVDVPLGARASRRLLAERNVPSLLQQNAGLAGGVKFGLAETAGQVHLLADLPLEQGQVPEPQFLDILAGVKKGMTQGTRSTRTRATTVSATQPQASDILEGLLEEAGSPFTKRASGQIAVQLDVREQFVQALIEEDPAVGIRLRTELPIAETASSLSRHAVSVLLLRACQTIRMARAAIGSGPAAPHYWEVCLPGLPTLDQLRHALAALSVAWKQTGREAEALQDERIVGAYLTTQDVEPA